MGIAHRSRPRSKFAHSKTVQYLDARNHHHVSDANTGNLEVFPMPRLTNTMIATA